MAEEHSKIVAAQLAVAVTGAKEKSFKQIGDGHYTVASVGALLKLLQLEKEMRVEGPQKLTVQWVETWESNHLNDE